MEAPLALEAIGISILVQDLFMIVLSGSFNISFKQGVFDRHGL